MMMMMMMMMMSVPEQQEPGWYLAEDSLQMPRNGIELGTTMMYTVYIYMHPQGLT